MAAVEQPMAKLEAAVRYSVRREWRKKAKISIGVPTYNGSERVGWLLQSMQNAGGLALDNNQVAITLLDDGSPRGDEVSKLLALGDRYDANVLVHHQNEGITRSWNDLVRFVNAEFCVLLNDDLILTPRWLENLIYFLENNECGAASPNLLFCSRQDIPHLLAGETVVPRHPHTRIQDPVFAECHPEEVPGAVMCALGSGFGFRRPTFDILGGFDERMKQIYNESDFGTAAAAKLNRPSYCIPAPRIWHLWSMSFQENPELHAKMAGDRAAYVAKWGGDFDYTHPKFMVGTMRPRIVKWISHDGQPREREMAIQ